MAPYVHQASGLSHSPRNSPDRESPNAPPGAPGDHPATSPPARGYRLPRRRPSSGTGYAATGG